MQTGIHYTKDNQKVKVLSIDEENKIAYVDYLDGQKKWVNEKEYAKLVGYPSISIPNELIFDNEPTVSEPVELSSDIVELKETPVTKKSKKKDDTTNKK